MDFFLEKILPFIGVAVLLWLGDFAIRFFIFWKMQQIDKEIEQMYKDGRLD